MDEHETKILSDFCHQLERSKQLFNGLRDLPQYGHKQWESYFGKTFDVYTKLWKFQQQHRLILEHKYGLRRWQIGEIASKIGQLYYHYYLRTSDTSYLHEAFAFYSAIRSRSYFSNKSNNCAPKDEVSKDVRPELLVKKLRYYARFIVVCLLLKRLKLVRELVVELGQLVDEYGSSCSANSVRLEEHSEWTKVLHEIDTFLAAENIVSVQDIDSNQLVLSQRLDLSSMHALSSENRCCGETLSNKRSDETSLSLQEILIVGNSATQVKFSELTVDMYRMIQTLEREPSDYSTSNAVTSASCSSLSSAIRDTGVDSLPQSAIGNCTNVRRQNPHKYLLYRPTFSQLMAFLVTGFKELPAAAVLLLYLSADGSFAMPEECAHAASDERYDFGGVVTDSRDAIVEQGDVGSEKRTLPDSSIKNTPHCLYPGDLIPFTRKPLFLIVDSDNAVVFSRLRSIGGGYFEQALVVLMSPQYIPAALQDASISSSGGIHHKSGDSQCNGRLLTLFLHSPLLAACFVCNLASVSVYVWQQCSRHLEQLFNDFEHLMMSDHMVDSVYTRMMADGFLRTLVLRFVFCRLVLSQHRHFCGDHYQPHEFPKLPTDDRLLANPSLLQSTRQLFSLLDARNLLVPLPATLKSASPSPLFEII